jgi:hypothetical protein
MELEVRLSTSRFFFSVFLGANGERVCVCDEGIGEGSEDRKFRFRQRKQRAFQSRPNGLRLKH